MKLPKLYQRALKDKINTWEIEVTDNKYRTITGFEGFKLTTSEWQYCEAKNVGKKNETTPNEQAQKEAQALYDKKIEKGFFTNITKIDTSTLFKPMLAAKYEDVDVTFPCYAQPKLDGVRCIIKADGMWTRNGKPIVSCPHIFESLKIVFEYNPDLVFDGELYNHKFKDDFNKLISLIKKTKPKQQDLDESAELVEYHIYDLPSSKGKFLFRWGELENLKDKIYYSLDDVKIKFVNTHFIEDSKELDMMYSLWTEQGYEGQMIRHTDKEYENKRSKSLLKRKEFFDEEFEILQVNEGTGKLAGRVGNFVFKNKLGHEFTSTVNGTQEYLEELLLQKDELIGQLATVKYFNLTPNTLIPRFPKVIGIRTYE